MLYLPKHELHQVYTEQPSAVSVALSEEARRLTTNPAISTPPEMLVRQAELPTDVQLVRAATLSRLLEDDIAATSDQLMLQAPNWRDEVDSMGISNGSIERPGTSASSKAWLDDVAAAIVKGWPVEMEAPGLGQREILQQDSMSRKSLSLGALYRKMADVAPNIRPIIGVSDEYDTYDQLGRPLDAHKRDALIVGAGSLMLDAGVIRPEDEPGREYGLIRMSDQKAKVADFADLLSGQGDGIILNDPYMLKFRPDASITDMQERRPGQDIALTYVRRFGGTIPSREFQQAATFLNSVDADANRHILHFGVESAINRQSVVGAQVLLRSTGLVGREQQHTLFYRESLADWHEAHIRYETASMLKECIDEYGRLLTAFTPWSGMDPYEYAARNFSTPTAEEAALVPEVIKVYKSLHLKPGSYERAIDIGSGPNLYGSMLITPFAKGNIILREYAKPNREFLDRLLSGTMSPEFAEEMWPQFEDLMTAASPELYQGAYASALRRSTVEAGSIFDLEEHSCDWLQALFVYESVVKSKLPFWQGLRIARNALRPANPDDPTDRGGIFTGAFIIGSEGWPAGEGTHFPAVMLDDIEDIGMAARDAGLEYVLLQADKDLKPMRKGYKGLAFMVAWRRDAERLKTITDNYHPGS